MFFLPHDVKLVRHLYLALSFQLFHLPASLLAVVLAQRVQSLTRIAQLGQLVLQRLILSWEFTYIYKSCILKQLQLRHSMIYIREIILC